MTRDVFAGVLVLASAFNPAIAEARGGQSPERPASATKPEVAASPTQKPELPKPPVAPATLEEEVRRREQSERDLGARIAQIEQRLKAQDEALERAMRDRAASERLAAELRAEVDRLRREIEIQRRIDLERQRIGDLIRQQAEIERQPEVERLHRELENQRRIELERQRMTELEIRRRIEAERQRSVDLSPHLSAEEKASIPAENRKFQTFGAAGVPAPGGGIRVVQANPGTPAAAFGLEEGDVILTVNGRPVNTTNEYFQAVWTSPDQMEFTYRNVRDGKENKGSVKLNRR